MRKTTLSILAIIIMAFLGACNTEDDLFVKNPEQTRKLTLTASMPDDDPTTRVALEKKDNNTIALTWETNDELQLLFVQNDFKKKTTVKVKSITEEGKKAQFDIVLPTEINDGTFTLYGIYGGGGLDDTNPAIVTLPANPGDATSLADVQTRKDVILYFESANIDATNPKAAVSFQHLGSLFNITLKNTATSNLENIKGARLVGVGGDGNWAYNNNAGAQTYNLLTGEFENKGTAGNYISFATTSSTLAANDEISFWGWYPPLPDKNWPELKLELWDETTANYTTANNKAARGKSTAAGKAYYFYAIWNGSKLSFTNSSFTPEYFIEEGGLGATLGDEKDNIEAMALRGSINANDFQVMKGMQALKHLDLSGVNVVGNKIPDYAFGDESTAHYRSIQKSREKIPSTRGGVLSSGFMPLESLILPETITAIGKYAFANITTLKGSLIIPDNVITIEEGAFYGCNNFNYSLILSENLETIEKYAFYKCARFKGNLTIHNKVTTIGDGAFYGCDNFDGDLTLSENLETIGKEAFYGCKNLKGSILIPDGVTAIEEGIFYNCSKLDGTLSLSDDITSIGKEAFYNCSALMGDLTIPEGVTTIGERAFANCSKLAGVLTLPNNMTSIGMEAFSGCSSLTGSLKVPKGLTIVESGTFAECNNLNGTLTLSSTLQTIGEDAFKNCSNLTGNLIIPTNVTLIEESAFNWCESFEGKLTIHSNISSVGMEAFSFCMGLTSLEVENVNTIIMPKAFEHCEGLQSFSLPSETTYILPEVFAYCSSLTSLNLPASLKIIGQGAFMGCKGLTALNLPEGLIKIKAEAFKWCDSFTTFSIPNSVTTIGDGAFANCNGFTGNLDLSIYPNLTTLGNSAFAYCSGFDGTLKLPPNITTVGQPIDDDDMLGWGEELVIPADGDIPWYPGIDQSVGHVFAGCSGFTGNLVIPHGITIIEESSFSGCSGLESLSLPSTLKEIKHHVFENCSGFKGLLTLPTSLTTIEYFAFHNCSGFTGNISIPNSVTTLDGNVFVSCAGFTSITLPSEITTIPSSLFEKCSGLSGTLDLSSYNNLTQIEYSAFEGCSSLTGLILPESIESIGSDAFKNCTSLNTRIIFPNSLSELLYRSFEGCESVTAFHFTRTTPIQHRDNMIPKNCTVEVPTGAYDSYKAAWPLYYSFVKY